jgi:hypothetical protein
MAPRQGPLLREVNKAIRGMSWLTDADKAAVAQARQYARSIDDAAEQGDAEYATKIAGWFGPHLTGLLKQLGGTPEGRKNLNVESKPVASNVTRIRDQLKSVERSA